MLDLNFKVTHLHLGINDISGVSLGVGNGGVGDWWRGDSRGVREMVGGRGEQGLLSVN